MRKLRSKNAHARLNLSLRRTLLCYKFLPICLYLQQGLKAVTSTYVLSLLLLASFISQSWSAPKVKLLFKNFLFIKLSTVMFSLNNWRKRALNMKCDCKITEGQGYKHYIYAALRFVSLLKGSFQRRNWTPQAMLYLKGTRMYLPNDPMSVCRLKVFIF